MESDCEGHIGCTTWLCRFTLRFRGIGDYLAEGMADHEARSSGHRDYWQELFLCGGLVVSVVLLAGKSVAEEQQGESDGAKKIFVASYYFPNYHPGDPRTTRRRVKTGVNGNW